MNRQMHKIRFFFRNLTFHFKGKKASITEKKFSQISVDVLVNLRG